MNSLNVYETISKANVIKINSKIYGLISFFVYKINGSILKQFELKNCFIDLKDAQTQVHIGRMYLDSKFYANSTKICNQNLDKICQRLDNDLKGYFLFIHQFNFESNNSSIIENSSISIFNENRIIFGNFSVFQISFSKLWQQFIAFLRQFFYIIFTGKSLSSKKKIEMGSSQALTKI